ncbi:hypothetical protein CONLIGDRAFT_12480 [Coniochaeta ligniaria NRRL 30616]|uniref:Uncharacterized protein n=1 Tax=Coniochaeta ligniaria NRRL 30616 TaxID=1408157 RepID=A0A1J7JMF6_9PEZI|nr:hypothetical protein CONLIGDRAFT_12480 [Coniochaeta ligniaria NRRL 30616]
MEPARRKQKTLESSTVSTSGAAKPDTKNQQDILDSKPVAEGEEDLIPWGWIGREPDEPNCLARPRSWYPTSIVSINFAPIDKGTYDFTEEFLTKNFQYFKSALHLYDLSGRVFPEGEAKHFDVEDITSQAFGRIFTYLERKARKPTGYKEGRDYKPENVVDLLLAVIAADFLGLLDFKKFEKYIAKRLAFALRMNPINMTPAVLLLVTEHHAFRSMLFWEICVKAAVKPCLRSKRAPHDIGRGAGNTDAIDERTWDKIHDHYDEMLKDCRWYAEAVQDAVRKTLRLSQRCPNRANCYDPLFIYTYGFTEVVYAREFRAVDPAVRVRIVRNIYSARKAESLGIYSTTKDKEFKMRLRSHTES